MCPTIDIHRKGEGNKTSFATIKRKIKLILHVANENGLKLLYSLVAQSLLSYNTLECRRALVSTSVVVVSCICITQQTCEI